MVYTVTHSPRGYEQASDNPGWFLSGIEADFYISTEGIGFKELKNALEFWDQVCAIESLHKREGRAPLKVLMVDNPQGLLEVIQEPILERFRFVNPSVTGALLTKSCLILPASAHYEIELLEGGRKKVAQYKTMLGRLNNYFRQFWPIDSYLRGQKGPFLVRHRSTKANSLNLKSVRRLTEMLWPDLQKRYPQSSLYIHHHPLLSENMRIAIPDSGIHLFFWRSPFGRK
jgi:hypothetical protein